MTSVSKKWWSSVSGEKGDRSPEAYARTLMTGDGMLWDTATSLLLRMAEATGCRLHIVHTTTSRQVEMIRAARKRGVKVTCEANHWTLFLATWELVQELGPYVLSYLGARAPSAGRLGGLGGRLDRHGRLRSRSPYQG